MYARETAVTETALQDNEVMNRVTLDARNLVSPLPIIRTQEKVEQLDHGDELEVLCTDPGALRDIPAWCRIHGHIVLDATERGGDIVVRLRVEKLA